MVVVLLLGRLHFPRRGTLVRHSHTQGTRLLRDEHQRSSRKPSRCALAMARTASNLGISISGLESALSWFRGTPSTGLVGVVLMNISDPERALHFFQWAGTRPGYTHSTYTWNVLLQVFVRAGRHVEAHRTLLGQVCSPDEVTYITLITAYCRSGELESAEELLKELIETSEPSSKAVEKLYNMVLSGYFSRGMYTRGLDFFQQMVHNCTPSLVTYNMFLTALCKAGRTDDALLLLDKMAETGVKPNIVSYNVILDGLCKEHRIQAAQDLFSFALGKGCRPTVITYSILIDGLCKVAQIDQALELFYKMPDHGCSPNLVTFSSMVDGLLKAGRVADSLRVFGEMKRVKDFKPDAVAYTVLLDGCCKRNKFGEALELIREMLELGCYPDVVTYSTIVHGLCRVGRVDDALELVVEMSKQGCQANVVTVNTVVDALCKAGRVDQALKQFGGLKLAPTFITYAVLIDGLSKSERVQEAVMLFKRVLQADGWCSPDVVTYTVLSLGLCKVGRFAEALEVFGSIPGGGDVIGYSIMIEKLCAGGWLDQAWELLQQMPGKGIYPSRGACHTLLAALVQAGRTDDAEKLREMLKSQRYGGFTG